MKLMAILNWLLALHFFIKEKIMNYEWIIIIDCGICQEKLELIIIKNYCMSELVFINTAIPNL